MVLSGCGLSGPQRGWLGGGFDGMGQSIPDLVARVSRPVIPALESRATTHPTGLLVCHVVAFWYIAPIRTSAFSPTAGPTS